MSEPAIRRNTNSGIVRGYLKGSAKAAAYLGIGRKAFDQWRKDTTNPERELLTPRVIRGNAYYSIAKLDKFMDPAANAGAEPVNHLAHV